MPRQWSRSGRTAGADAHYIDSPAGTLRDAGHFMGMHRIEPRPPAFLVVEDEILVRTDLVGTIEAAGFATYEAGSADEAIKLLEAHPEIRVLFTDIDMPGSMDGLKLSHYVRHRWPPVHIIIASGHRQATLGQMPERAVFISKPYMASDLNKAFEDFKRASQPSA